MSKEEQASHSGLAPRTRASAPVTTPSLPGIDTKSRELSSSASAAVRPSHAEPPEQHTPVHEEPPSQPSPVNEVQEDDDDDSVLSGPELRAKHSGELDASPTLGSSQGSDRLSPPGSVENSCTVICQQPYTCRPLTEGTTPNPSQSTKAQPGYPRVAACLSCGLTEFKVHNSGTKGNVPFWQGLDTTCCGVQCHGASGTTSCCLSLCCGCCLINSWASLVHRCTGTKTSANFPLL